MKLFRSWSLMVLIVWCSATIVARADTVFDLNATLTGAGNIGNATLTGTLSINTATGALTGFNFTFTNPGANAYNTTYLINRYFGGPTTGTSYTELGFFGSVAPYQASLFLCLPAPAPLIGYAGGAICSTSSLCSGQYSAISLTGTTNPPLNASYTVDSGTLTAETPEPSSFLLMATGLGGLAGLMRRPRARRAAWGT